VVDIKRDQHWQGRHLGSIVPFGHRRSADSELVADATKQHIARYVQARR
jgi:hypothetical protein